MRQAPTSDTLGQEARPPSRWSPAVWVFLPLACCACYLPFLDKGVTYDDVIYLEYAERLTKNPFRCEVSDLAFQGRMLEDYVVFESTHPPLIPYYIRVVTHLFGENIALLHFAFLPFLLLASLGLGDLVQRYTGHSPLLALGVTLGPLFLPAATWLMTDAPLFAFWVAAIAAWERALAARGKAARAWTLVCVLATLAASFTAYQGLGILPLLLLRGWVAGHGRGALLVAVSAAAPLALWLFLIWLHYGIFPYFSPPREELSIATEVGKGLVGENIWLKTRVLALYLGAGLFFFLPLALFFKGWPARFYLILALCGWGWALTLNLFPEWTNLQRLFPGLLASLGLLALPLVARAVEAGRSHPRDKPWLWMLLLWLLGIACFQLFLAAFAAPRYILPLLAPLLILLLTFIPRDGFARGLSLGALALSIAAGLVVALADEEYADAQRIDQLNLEEYGKIHFVGEKGMKYNGERAGWRYFMPGMENEVGYLLVTSEIDRIAIPAAMMERLEPVAEFPIPGRWPLRVMNREAKAGFYIHTRGLLPFSWSDRRLESFVLYKHYQPGNAPWRTEPVDIQSAGNILPDRPVIQDFQCLEDGLTILQLNLATNARVNQSTLVVVLQELRPDGGEPRLVFREEVDASILKDNAWREFQFEPQASKGKTYRVRLESPDATPASAVTIWTNREAKGFFHCGEERVAGAIGLVALCFNKF